MDQAQKKIQMLDLRIVASQLAYARGNWFQSFEHTSTGVYTITLSKAVDYEELNVRCALFGNPVVSD